MHHSKKHIPGCLNFEREGLKKLTVRKPKTTLSKGTDFPTNIDRMLNNPRYFFAGNTEKNRPIKNKNVLEFFKLYNIIKLS